MQRRAWVGKVLRVSTEMRVKRNKVVVLEADEVAAQNKKKKKSKKKKQKNRRGACFLFGKRETAFIITIAASHEPHR